MTERLGDGMAADKQREQVAEDLVRLFSEEVSEADAQRIKQWREGTDEYQREFLESAHLLGGLDVLVNDEDILSLLDEPEITEPARTRRWPVLAMAATVLIALGVVFIGQDSETAIGIEDRFVTRVGEQKSIEISDGSHLTLNTNTRLLVSVGEDRRHVTLEQGEAYFDVASDPARPFTVDVGDRMVMVLGTAFNIYRESEKVTLAVSEGVVAFGVDDAQSLTDLDLSEDVPAKLAGGVNYRIEAGAVLEYDVPSGELLAYRPKDVGDLSVWKSGMIRFDEQPLVDVVRELNRYSGKQIVIEDRAIESLNIYATVKLNAIDRALTGLEYSLPIKVEKSFDRIVITGDDS